jgi:predicted dehydrogenase
LNIGFIGCGNIAHFHADVLKALGVNISAVSARENSPNISQFSKKYKIQKQYADWRKMVDNEALDALWAVPSWTQLDTMLIPLIETGVPLFLEKPVALSSAKIREAIDLHAGIKQYIQVGYNRRFYPFMDEIKSYIETGNLRSVIVEIPESVNLADAALAKNLWVMNSSHIIDLLLLLLGPLDVKYKNHKIMADHELPTSFNAVLETKHRIPVHLSAEWNTANNFGITFFVDAKKITLKPLEIAVVYEGFDVLEPTKKTPVRQYIPKKIKELFCDGEFKPGFYEQAKFFINNYTSTSNNNCHSDLESSFSLLHFTNTLIN